VIQSSTGSPQATPDIEKYVAIMKEIKLRTEVIDVFLSGQRGAIYTPTTVGSKYSDKHKK
jgi:hypothetical protein